MRTIKELHILFREAVSDTFFIWRKEAGRVVRDPVSYTHLDVYKRQM